MMTLLFLFLKLLLMVLTIPCSAPSVPSFSVKKLGIGRRELGINLEMSPKTRESDPIAMAR